MCRCLLPRWVDMAFEMRQSRSCTNLWTTQQAAALISSWNHFRTVTTTPTFLDNADWHDYSLTPLPSWLSISRLTASFASFFQRVLDAKPIIQI